MLSAVDAGEGEVFASVHPHGVAIHRNQPEGTPRNVFLASVESIETVGPRARVRVSGQLPLVAEVTPAAVEDLGLAQGVTVWVSFKATEVATYPA
jgi:molybdate transport system ATP-binding protein